MLIWNTETSCRLYKFLALLLFFSFNASSGESKKWHCKNTRWWIRCSATGKESESSSGQHTWIRVHHASNFTAMRWEAQRRFVREADNKRFHSKASRRSFISSCPSTWLFTPGRNSALDKREHVCCPVIWTKDNPGQQRSRNIDGRRPPPRTDYNAKRKESRPAWSVGKQFAFCFHGVLKADCQLRQIWLWLGY